MKHNKLVTAMAFALTLSLTSCSDDETNTSQQVSAPAVTQVAKKVQVAQSSLLDYIPADTPVLMAFVHDPKNPIPKNLEDKVGKIYDSLGTVFKQSFLEAYNDYSKKAGHEENAIDEDNYFFKLFNDDGMKKLGLSMDETEMAFYAVDLFPVARLKLASGHSVGEVLDELMAKANEKKAGTAVKKDVAGATVYQIGDKEAQVIVSLKGNSLVASFAPTRQVDELMPKLFGYEKPLKSLTQSANYHDVLSKYNYLSTGVYWINFRQLADYFVNPAKHPSAMLDLLKVEDNKFSETCKTEILQIFDKFPRLLGGTKKWTNMPYSHI